MTFGSTASEDAKLNHMGLPGRRGCGKGNTVQGLLGGGPWTFSVSPPLPRGLTINPQNGAISGVPMQRCSVGAVVHTITAANQVGTTNTQVSIEILTQPTPPSMPEYEFPKWSMLRSDADPSSGKKAEEQRGSKHSWVVVLGDSVRNNCRIQGSPPFAISVRPELP